MREDAVPVTFGLRPGLPAGAMVVRTLPIVRSNYYTSFVGDDPGHAALIREMKRLPSFSGSYGAGTYLYPVVFKKPAKSPKTTTVDVRLTVDMLSHVYQNNIDLAFLLTGDGDFAPLVEEVVRRGTQVWLAAFSDGLSDKLTSLADVVTIIDDQFFEPTPVA